jgi:hypothetical protein
LSLDAKNNGFNNIEIRQRIIEVTLGINTHYFTKMAKHGIRQDIYDQYHKKCDIRKNDILLVRDGTYLIRTTAFVTQYDVDYCFRVIFIR